MDDLNKRIRFLADSWCESRNLEPLRLLLNARASLNGLTDGWEELRRNLQTIRSRYSDNLPEEEIDALVSAIHIADEVLQGHDT